MRPPAQTFNASDRVSLTPMIDVVFLLIIFFLVSSHLARRERRQPIDLVKSVTGQRLDSEVQVEAWTLSIDEQSQAWLDGRKITDEAFVKAYRGTETPPPIRLRTDRRVPYGTVKKWLQTLHREGVKKLDVITENAGAARSIPQR